MTFTPNPDQIKAIIRWLITAFGAGLAGWLAHSGFVTADQVLGILNSPAFLSVAVSAIGLVWGIFTHTQVNTVAAANALPAVAGVITAPTIEGKALADALPASVAVAGTQAATAVAAK